MAGLSRTKQKGNTNTGSSKCATNQKAAVIKKKIIIIIEGIFPLGIYGLRRKQS